MSGVRLSNKKISSILDRQSELEASLDANINDDDGWKALEQLQEQLSGAIRRRLADEADKDRRIIHKHKPSPRGQTSCCQPVVAPLAW